MSKRRKARFNSLSTPGHKQDCSNYLVELAFLRQNHGKKLPKSFWKMTRYKTRYRQELIACRKFIKKYGEPLVLKITLRDFRITTWRDYGKVEMVLQREQEKAVLKARPKDTSDVAPENPFVSEDLRPTRPTPSKRLGLFDKLKQLEKANGQKENS